jgi:Fe-S-cluster containining protein
MIEPSKIASHAARREKENLKFRTFLKGHVDDDELDAQFLALHNELFAFYDCCKCNNCCRVYDVTVQTAESKAMADFLCVSESTLASQHFENSVDDETGEACYVIKTKPCPFLQRDGKCQIQSCKPTACKDYPFTSKPGRLFSLYSILESAEHCPVVFEMLERLKKIYRFRLRR